ncbi:MAG: cbiQ2 [Firmicutes bacterium]|nr:cbiQ2 [Bacillota bacterium]
MSEIKKSINRISNLEELTYRDTVIHRLPPVIKLLMTVIFLVTVISFGSEQVSGLFPFLLYPVLLMTVAEIPMRPLLTRLLIALPFTLFAGLSNMFFSKEAAMMLGGIIITKGMLVFVSILIKTILSVMSVLILVSTTSMNDLLYAMLYLHIPTIIVLQIMMTFRYLSVLAGEISVMYHAYILRAPREKGIKLIDMGPFLGQLIIRSFDRADRIYHAMKCRGFEGGVIFSEHKKVRTTHWLGLMIVSVVLLILRFVNLSELIGQLVIG